MVNLLMLNFLKRLNKLSPTQRRSFIDKLSNREVDYLSEVCKNFLNGNIQVGFEKIRQLIPVCTEIRALASKSIKKQVKIRIFKTIRGAKFLKFLLPHAVSTLINLI